MQDASLFTRIISGEIPSYKIYENDLVIAILNINPVQYGHTLVIPKAQVDHLEDLEDEYYTAVMEAVRVLSLHIRDILQSERICIAVEGFEVPHAHVHLIPCDTADDFKAEPEEASSDGLAELAERLTY